MLVKVKLFEQEKLSYFLNVENEGFSAIEQDLAGTGGLDLSLAEWPGPVDLSEIEVDTDESSLLSCS